VRVSESEREREREREREIRSLLSSLGKLKILPKVLMQERSVRHLRAGWRQFENMQSWAAWLAGLAECRRNPSKSWLPMKYWAQCYRTFYVLNLRLFVISKSVCHLKASTA
jgi:hypothetical protein